MFIQATLMRMITDRYQYWSQFFPSGCFENQSGRSPFKIYHGRNCGSVGYSGQIAIDFAPMSKRDRQT